MGDRQEVRDSLLIRVQKVNPWGPEDIVDDILSTIPYEGISNYISCSDKKLRNLIADRKKGMNSKVHSPVPDFPVLSSSCQQKGSAKRKSRSHLPSVNQGNSAEDQVLKHGSAPGIDTTPSHSQRALDGEDLTGSASATDGPLWPSTDKKFQSSSTRDDNFPVRGIPSPPSRSPLTTFPCHSYITLGVCDNVCPFSHGFTPLGRLEMDIRQFLLRCKPSGVMIGDLPGEYFQRYRTSVTLKKGWDWGSLLPFLDQLHTTTVLHGSKHIILLEYAAAPRLTSNDSNKIGITYSKAGSSLTRALVCDYFRKYVPVTSWTIDDEGTQMVGFIEFENPGSVSLLLEEWHHQIPHSIFSGSPFDCYEARVFVQGYNKQNAKARHDTNCLSSG